MLPFITGLVTRLTVPVMLRCLYQIVHFMESAFHMVPAITDILYNTAKFVNINVYFARGMGRKPNNLKIRSFEGNAGRMLSIGLFPLFDYVYKSLGKIIN